MFRTATAVVTAIAVAAPAAAATSAHDMLRPWQVVVHLEDFTMFAGSSFFWQFVRLIELLYQRNSEILL